jgi:tetratricopeptide (TPR) repeat protein
MQAAELFIEAQDYAGALHQFEETLRYDPANAAAMAGAGEAAFHSGNYTVAQRYLRSAVNANSDDASSRQLLESADLVVRSNPFYSHISDIERNRRIIAAFAQAEKRLNECAQKTGTNLNPPDPSSATPLSNLQSRWNSVKPNLDHLQSPAETDLPDTIMDVVFQIEQQTAAVCGPPQGLDQALLLITQKREALSQ